MCLLIGHFLRLHFATPNGLILRSQFATQNPTQLPRLYRGQRNGQNRMCTAPDAVSRNIRGVLMVLDPESEQIREVFATFGLAIYGAQCLERQLAMLITALGASGRFTAWDYDDRLAGNFDSTFGALVASFSEVAQVDHKSLVIDLEKAVQERNELVHQYFWNRVVDFNSASGRVKMLDELRETTAHFDSIDAELTKLTHGLMEKHGVTQAVVDRELHKMLEGVEPPHDPKQIRKPVTITGACEWRVGDSVECAIVFTSDTGNLVLGEMGLCLGPQNIPPEQLCPKPEFAKALPVTVNPKPKKAGSWNYVIPLANGYEVRVRPDERDGKQIVRFGLRKANSKVKK